MKIIKPGKLPESKPPKSYEGVCLRCGCEFIAIESEIVVHNGGDYHSSWLSVECPTAFCCEPVEVLKIDTRSFWKQFFGF